MYVEVVVEVSMQSNDINTISLAMQGAGKEYFNHVERSHQIAFMLVREREGQTRGEKRKRNMKERWQSLCLNLSDD